MGAGASTPNPLDAYGEPLETPDGVCFPCKVRETADLVRRTSGGFAYLEIGPVGFRVLQAAGPRRTGDALAAYAFAQVHSWLRFPTKFAFQFFDERSKEIVTYSFECLWVARLMEHLHGVVNGILEKRRSQALSSEEFDGLVARLRSMPPEGRLGQVSTYAATNYFSATQGLTLVECLEEGFDRIEAICQLHPHLIDQNNFNVVLSCLPDRAERDNVWHRIKFTGATGAKR